MRGLDISHFQGDADFQKVDGFCIMKATQGTSWIDPKFIQNQSGSRKAGLLTGYYHFSNGGDPIKEADWFKDVVQPNEGEIMALDWEIQHNDPVGWCKAFLDRLGGQPIIYLNSSTAGAYDWTPCLGYRLWIANYGVNDGTRHENPPTGKWPSYFIHQYTSRGKVDGIQGNVDLNYMPEINSKPMFTMFNQLEYPTTYLGNTKYTVAKFGCLSLVINMGYNFLFGKNVQPPEMVKILTYSPDGNLQWGSLSKIGLKLVKRISQSSTPYDAIKAGYENPNQFVALELHNGAHFVWVIGRWIPLLGYRIVNPFGGRKEYCKNNISGCRIVEKI